MKTARYILPGLFSLLVIACNSTPQPMVSEYSYAPYPNPKLNPEQVIINKSMDEAWTYTIDTLKANLFTIINIDRNERLISLNVNYGAHMVGAGDWWLQYASCGETQRINTFKGTQRQYNYPVLGYKSYQAAARGLNGLSYLDEITATISPAINLDVKLRQIDAKTTALSVDANYVFAQTSKRRRYSLRKDGVYRGIGSASTDRKVINVHSYQATVFSDEVVPPILCYSTGEFENTVLNSFR
jgi:hypothetical protein